MAKAADFPRFLRASQSTSSLVLQVVILDAWFRVSDLGAFVDILLLNARVLLRFATAGTDFEI